MLRTKEVCYLNLGLTEGCQVQEQDEWRLGLGVGCCQKSPCGPKKQHMKEYDHVYSPIVNGPNVSGQTVSHTTSRALKVVGPIVSGPSLNGPLVC